MPIVPGCPVTSSGVPCDRLMSITEGVIARTGMNAVAPRCGGSPVSTCRTVGIGKTLLRRLAEQLITGLLLQLVNAAGYGLGPGGVGEQVSDDQPENHRTHRSPEPGHPHDRRPTTRDRIPRTTPARITPAATDRAVPQSTDMAQPLFPPGSGATNR